MKTILNTAADVRRINSILLDQVMEKQNYDIKVHCNICYVECEPGDAGYDMGSCTFLPWGADAYNVMTEFFENTVSEDYINLELTIDNLQEPVVEAAFYKRRPITEDNVREFFNVTFSYLDDAKSAGAVYVGDNGAYILDYIDITQEQAEKILTQCREAFGGDSCIGLGYHDNCFQIHIS